MKKNTIIDLFNSVKGKSSLSIDLKKRGQKNKKNIHNIHMHKHGQHILTYYYIDVFEEYG